MISGTDIIDRVIETSDFSQEIRSFLARGDISGILHDSKYYARNRHRNGSDLWLQQAEVYLRFISASYNSYLNGNNSFEDWLAEGIKYSFTEYIKDKHPFVPDFLKLFLDKELKRYSETYPLR